MKDSVELAVVVNTTMKLVEFTHIDPATLYRPVSPSNATKRLERLARHRKQIEQEEMRDQTLPFELQSEEYRRSIGWDEQTEWELLRLKAEKARQQIAKHEQGEHDYLQKLKRRNDELEAALHALVSAS